MIRGRWFYFFLPLTFLIHLLTDCCAAFNRVPESVDFYYDPLMPRINDTLILEVDTYVSDPTARKPTSYRWFYRELDSPPDAFREIGVGGNVYYNITSKFRDGYFKLSAIYCCDSRGKMYQRKSVKLIRIQRPLSVEVFLNGNHLPGNESTTNFALSKPHVNIECRISGMPTSFSIQPPLGVACDVHQTRNKLRYLSVVRRRCRFSPGTYKCSARNDLSRVTMLHYVNLVVPGQKRKPVTKTIPKTTKIPRWGYSPTPFSTRDNDVEEKNVDKDTNIWESDSYDAKPRTKVVTVSKAEKTPKHRVVKPVGTKKNTARQCHSCTTTIAIATLTWLVTMRH